MGKARAYIGFPSLNKYAFFPPEHTQFSENILPINIQRCFEEQWMGIYYRVEKQASVIW